MTKTAPLSTTLKIAVATAVIGSSFQFGYNIAACNSAAESFYTYYSEAQYETYWANFVVAIFAVGALIGSNFVSQLTTRYGPAGALKLVNIVSFLAAACYWLSKINTVDMNDKPADALAKAQLNKTD